MIRFGDLDLIFNVTRLILLHEAGWNMFSSCYIMKFRLYSLKNFPKNLKATLTPKPINHHDNNSICFLIAKVY